MEYDASYSHWKNWNSSDFGFLSTPMRKYYLAETQRLGRIVDRPNLNVLEVGFGNGGFLQFARQQGWQISGTELNPELLRFAREGGFNVVSGEQLPSLPEKSFDAIFAFDVLEHIEQAEIPTLLLQIRSLLRPTGVFFARFPNGDSPLGLINQNGDLTHVSALGSGKIGQLSKQVGAQSFFLGRAAEPIFTGKPLSTIHAMVSIPIKAVLNFLLNMLLSPKREIAYLSGNLVWIVKF